jgi:hypothetical protein
MIPRTPQESAALDLVGDARRLYATALREGNDVAAWERAHAACFAAWEALRDISRDVDRADPAILDLRREMLRECRASLDALAEARNTK